MMESLIRQFYTFFYIVLFSSWVAAGVRFEALSDEEIKNQSKQYNNQLHKYINTLNYFNINLYFFPFIFTIYNFIYAPTRIGTKQYYVLTF